MSSTSPAVGRALDVLLHLASRPGPVQGSALIRDVGMPRSSAYHLLDVLIERGFVVHLPDQRAYALGFSAFEVGSAYLRHAPLDRVAPRVLAFRGGRAEPGRRAARAHRPANPQAVGHARRRDSPPRNPLRRR